MLTITIDDALAARLMDFAGENESLDAVVARLLTEYLDERERAVGTDTFTTAS